MDKNGYEDFKGNSLIDYGLALERTLGNEIHFVTKSTGSTLVVNEIKVLAENPNEHQLYAK